MEDAVALAASLPGAVLEHPFGPETDVYKVAGRIFALAPESHRSVSLKCDPDIALDLRAKHGGITPGYHLNKRHWNTVVLDGSVPDDLVAWMIEHSYDLVLDKLPARTREALRRQAG